MDSDVVFDREIDGVVDASGTCVAPLKAGEILLDSGTVCMWTGD